ncbi:sulfotransferase [Caulobacter sp. KR2-114]|uniref:tetratricopeptide repeat-containing sulfotransferase family protein n=1 Tax=Caulobacter sp. KR2-114 TaxID=3400912 RepID=UPI003C08CF7D
MTSSGGPVRAASSDPVAEALAQCQGLLRARRPAEALALVARLPPGARGDPRVAARVAYAQALLGRFAETATAAVSALADPALDAASLDLAGNALTLAQRPGEAHAAFTRAAALAPGQPGVLFNLATTARFLGRAAEAEDAYDRVIAAAPDAWEAWRNRSELRRQTPQANHVAELTRLLHSGRIPPPGRVQLEFALGKELEDLGDHDGAFAAFDRGARLRRSHMRYDVREDVETLALIARTFDAAWCAPGREVGTGASGQGPIFILGLPRTGSTLLETMLGRHSQVQPLGELQTFGAAVVAGARRAAPQPPAGKAALIAASALADPSAIGADYLAGVAPLRDERPRFTDKLPINMLYAGLIARALPQAAIVHITRRPLDACVAIYKTLFAEAYPWSYDLAELGAYHRAYDALMQHWRAALGARLIEVAYEDLAADPAATLAGLMPRLGLAIEPQCLDAAAGDAPVMTASASQARAPVHTRSVGAAERYRRHLGPLVAALGQG